MLEEREPFLHPAQHRKNDRQAQSARVACRSVITKGHPTAVFPTCPADAFPTKAINRFAPLGLPRPVQGSHPAVALYPPLLPMEMSFKAAVTPCEHNRGLRKPTH